MAKTTQPPETGMQGVMHEALPNWYASFQKSFGLSFLILCSGYLMGKLATLGWVKDLESPLGWGWFNGAGVVFFFLGGLVIAGIGLTCSVAFVRAISVKPRQPFLALFTLVGMVIFFGIEVWASLSERSTYLVATPADRAVLSAFGFQGIPSISPTVLVVSLMFPFGSLYYGFVQQGKARKSQAELDDEKLSHEQELAAERHKAELAALRAKTRQQQVKGLGGMVRAGAAGVRGDDVPSTVTDVVSDGGDDAPDPQ